MERSARTRHLGERHSGRTAATTAMRWFEELVAADAEKLTAWRNRRPWLASTASARTSVLEAMTRASRRRESGDARTRGQCRGVPAL